MDMAVLESKKEEPIKEEKIEEVKTEEVKEKVEEKPICDHSNYEKELVIGTCVKRTMIYETCKDCGHVTIIQEDYDPSNHEGTQTKMYDAPSCSSKYRISFTHCESCGADYNEEWIGPHSDRDGDSVCDECGESLSN